jgi:putative peptidoglycan lipid II flippase
MSENAHVTRAAGIVALATLLSRILGLVRDLVTAYFFGASLAADAFFVAFRIPNLLRRLLAEGALTVSFIPIFTEFLAEKGREDAFALARATLTLLSIVLAIVTILGILLSPYIIMVFAPGFTDDPDQFQLTVLLTKIVFPYIFLVGLVALAMGILNSLGKFAGPALSPVMLNIGMIGAVMLLSRKLDPPILSLAIGVLIGGLLQVCLQIPYLAKEGGLLGISFQFRHPTIKRIGLLMAPAALGAAVYQFSVFINTLLASFLPAGSVSYLYYADRIMQFPLGIFAIAIGTAVLPSLSRQAAFKDFEGMKDTLSFALRLVFFITIPSMVGIILLSSPLLELIFERGEFTATDTQATAGALIAYAAGLWSLSAVQIVVRVFYSLQDTRTPVKIAVVSLGLTTLLSVILMAPLKHVGLAVASSAGSTINLVLLIIYLKPRLGNAVGKDVWISLGKNVLWSIAMAIPVGLMVGFHRSGMGTIRLTALVLGASLIGTLVYFGSAIMFRSSEMTILLDIAKRKLRRKKP